MLPAEQQEAAPQQVGELGRDEERAERDLGLRPLEGERDAVMSQEHVSGPPAGEPRAAVHHEDRAGDPVAGGAREIGDHLADVVRRAPSAERNACGAYSSIRKRSGARASGGVKAVCTPSVGIGPGATALTVMRSGAHSSASVRVSASTPALAAVACAMSGQPR